MSRAGASSRNRSLSRRNLSGFDTTRTPTMDAVHDVEHERRHHLTLLHEDRGRLAVEDHRLRPAVDLLGHVDEEARAASGSHHGPHGRSDLAPAVGPDHDVVREHGEQTREVPGRAGDQEAVRELAAVAEVGIEALAAFLDVPAGPCSELPARSRRPAQRRGPPRRRSTRRCRGAGMRRVRVGSAPRAGPRRPARESLPARPHPARRRRPALGARGPRRSRAWLGPSRAGRGRAGSRSSRDRRAPSGRARPLAATTGRRHPAPRPPRRPRSPTCGTRCRRAAGATPRTRPRRRRRRRRRRQATAGPPAVSVLGMSQESENP